MTAADSDAWEDAHRVPSPRSVPPAACHDDAPESPASRPLSDASVSDVDEWGFDLSELEHEMAALAPVARTTPLTASDASCCREEMLVSALATVPTTIRRLEERMRQLEALARVARLHVVAARGSVAQWPSTCQQPEEPVEQMEEELQQVAGEWGHRALLATTLTATERRRVDAMASVLHHALEAETDDLVLFQDVLEQLFAGLTAQTLVLSTNWLKPAQGVDKEGEVHSYVDQIVALYSGKAAETSRIRTLSEAAILQDAKDIGRDEVVINGDRVHGKHGYDAVVDALQRELELVLARQVGKTPKATPMAVSNALHAVAMAVLHASNRTESGGTSYDVLATLLTNRAMDRVVLRPASARAAPLCVDMDVGPYVETLPGATIPTWAFGLRVKLTAVTWYLVCDALDPSRELYEMETTYCTRLAFPIGLTPFHPLDCMRKDSGSVAIRLRTPSRRPPVDAQNAGN